VGAKVCPDRRQDECVLKYQQQDMKVMIGMNNTDPQQNCIEESENGE
jgi:hypothetical protein